MKPYLFLVARVASNFGSVSKGGGSNAGTVIGGYTLGIYPMSRAESRLIYIGDRDREITNIPISLGSYTCLRLLSPNSARLNINMDEEEMEYEVGKSTIILLSTP